MRKFAILVLALTGITIAVGQSTPDSKPAETEPVYVVENNGNVITETGCNLIEEGDVVSVRVRHDSVFFTLKEDALKKLDANPAQNYKQEKQENSKSEAKK